MTPHANVGIHTTSTMILCVLAPRITSVIEIYYRGCDTLIHISKFTWHKTFILYSQSYATSFEARRRTHISAYYIFLTARFLCKLAKPVFLFQIRKLHLNSARDSYKGLNRMFVFFSFRFALVGYTLYIRYLYAFALFQENSHTAIALQEAIPLSGAPRSILA